MTAAPRLLLASASPRRLDLLRQIGIEPAGIVPAEIDETPGRDELPRALAARLAAGKAAVVSGGVGGDAVILAADTVVAVGRRALPKAEDEATARACLAFLSGRRHRVHGGITAIGPDGTARHRLVETAVAFKRLTRAEIDRYIESGDWHGKAGGYAIQGRAAAFVRQVNGSYSNVVGLGLFETANLLESFGIMAR
ncbi:septum formation protein Maf [Marivibrio halodurans]|uniref:dTTP/UTP pyrophosphatase n=1 Tax=Marivibrio halodurans TaxID=2039722 RepID=A0A8J7S590_9PROT|nr:Maf family nucleotide pyrophosphatase [Marivibrio halodurans]MBP5855832.1 septum formation protein Maf [Marivibrio halodurans]